MGKQRSLKPSLAMGDAYLPLDVLGSVIDVLRREGQMATLSTFMLACHSTYDFIGPILYKDLVVTRENAPGIFRGLPELARTSRSIHVGRTTFIPFETLRSESFQNEHTVMVKEYQDGHGEHGMSIVPPTDATMWAPWDVPYPSNVEYPSFSQTYPTEHSAARKTALLAHTRTLRVESLPPPDFCRRLQLMAHADGEFIRFKGFWTLTLGAQAFWDLTDFPRRLRDMSNDPPPPLIHPLIDFLATSQPAAVCVHLPSPDLNLEARFVIPRAFPHEEYWATSRLPHQQYPEILWPWSRYDVLTGNYMTSLFQILAGGIEILRNEFNGVERLTLHNAPLPLINYIPDLPETDTDSVPLSYRPCFCQNSSSALGEYTSPHRCWDHRKENFVLNRSTWWWTCSKDDYNELVSAMNAKKPFAIAIATDQEEETASEHSKLLDSESDDSSSDSDVDITEDEIKDLVKDVEMNGDAGPGDWPIVHGQNWLEEMGDPRHEGREPPRGRFAKIEDTEPCVCCGLKTLNPEQASSVPFRIGHCAYKVMTGLCGALDMVRLCSDHYLMAPTIVLQKLSRPTMPACAGHLNL